MKVVNPPVFDHIVGLGGGNWIPFEDIYNIATFNVTALGVVTKTAAVLRNYANCKGVSSRFALALNPDTWYHFLILSTSGTIYGLGPQLIETNTVGLIATCTAFTGLSTVGGAIVKVSGWAPAP
jgi:exosortase/archaeosortase